MAARGLPQLLTAWWIAFAIRRLAAAVLLVLAAVMLSLQKVSPVDPVLVQLVATASSKLVIR